MVPNYQNSKEISLKAGWVQVHPTRGSTLILFFFLNSKQREEKLRDERQSLRASAWGETLHLLRFFFFFSWSARPPVKKKTGGTQRCNSIDVRSQTLQRSTGRTIYGENDHVPFSKKVLPWTNIHSKPSDKIRIKQQSVNTPLFYIDLQGGLKTCLKDGREPRWVSLRAVMLQVCRMKLEIALNHLNPKRD